MAQLSIRMALRPYLDGLRQACEQMTREQLMSFILQMGQEVSMEGRAGFLEKLHAHAPQSLVSDQRKSADAVETLFDQLTALREEIELRIASIEDGTYGDDNRDWDGAYDDEPDYVTPEQVGELGELIVETGDLFVQGRFREARKLYGVLFDLMDEHPEVTHSLSDLDLQEARAQYCRSVYETAEPDRRLEEFVQSMRIEGTERSFPFDASCDTHPLLQEVMDSTADAMPRLESFLPAWEKRLADFSSRRAALLRLEAVERLEGMAGITRLAREWRSDQPCGYLHWIRSLERQGDLSGMCAACEEALADLPPGAHREKAADLLATAGGQLGDRNLVLQGKRERFRSAPGENNLMELLAEAENQQVRSEELAAILAYQPSTSGNKGLQGSLRVKIQLMASRLEEAFDEGQGVGGVGWSHGKAGVLFGGVLSVLTDNAGGAAIVQDLLKHYCVGDVHRFGPHGLERMKGKEEIYREVLLGLSSVKLSPDQKMKLLAWAETIGRDRIETIVSSQSRGAYDRAAQVLGALAECKVCMKAGNDAKSLVREFVQVKFPRHHAFRKEVKRVVDRSSLLKGLQML
ncbi:MAG: hypothetical protein HGA63_06970 [Syntrophobacteraceae bacterium]|nr:hypothetical protein [Syntrophobacteraceae bacterium]